MRIKTLKRNTSNVIRKGMEARQAKASQVRREPPRSSAVTGPAAVPPLPPPIPSAAVVHLLRRAML